MLQKQCAHLFYEASALKEQPLVSNEQTLEIVLHDLHILQSLVPRPDFPRSKLSWKSIVRLILLCTPVTAIVANFVVPPKVLVSLLGATLLTWRAPWAAFIRRRLWSSAWVRWSFYHAWSWLSATPLPYSDLGAVSAQSQETQTATTEKGEKGPQLRFLFTVHENQRWSEVSFRMTKILMQRSGGWVSISPLHFCPMNDRPGLVAPSTLSNLLLLSLFLSLLPWCLPRLHQAMRPR